MFLHTLSSNVLWDSITPLWLPSLLTYLLQLFYFLFINYQYWEFYTCIYILFTPPRSTPTSFPLSTSCSFSITCQVCFWDNVSHRAGRPSTCYVAEDDLKLLILLPQPCKCWNCKIAPSHPVFSWFWTEPKSCPSWVASPKTSFLFFIPVMM